MKIDNTHYNAEAIKRLRIEDFVERHKHISEDEDVLRDIYYKITGNGASFQEKASSKTIKKSVGKTGGSNKVK